MLIQLNNILTNVADSYNDKINKLKIAGLLMNNYQYINQLESFTMYVPGMN